MAGKYTGIRGTLDFNPSQTAVFNRLTATARQLLRRWGYEEIMLPFLEERGVFAKGVGDASDIVERQLFKIEGKDIVLRPEGTAQVIRYYIQNSLHKQSDFWKFFYIGPMFRGERPQKGRLRQFHHIGVEAIGSASYTLDAELILLALALLGGFGISDTTLQINTLGCARDKDAFSVFLRKALAAGRAGLCQDCSRRLEKNPLRVLDCKRPECRAIVEGLGLDNTHICQECMDGFRGLLSFLDGQGVKYRSTPYLVRGLDYYTNTVFEITSSALGSQDALGAGGRYNNLVRFLGGTDVPAVGFALGLERILLLLPPEAPQATLDAFIALTSSHLFEAGAGILRSLRQEGLACDIDYCQKSLKAQLRLAQKKGIRFVVIIGDEELSQGCVLLKDMAQASQEKVAVSQLSLALKRKGG